jgi:hypothetical protein
MTAPMASASLPSRPTSGETAAPTPNCTAPSRAAAEPADSPYSARASAGAFGSANPEANSTAHSGTATPNRPPVPVAARASSTPPAIVPTTVEVTRICAGENQRSSTGLSWVAEISQTAPMPKSRPNCCSSRPNCCWYTNDEPDT